MSTHKGPQHFGPVTPGKPGPQTKFTPGPWECKVDAHGRGRVYGSGCWVCTTWTLADDDTHKRYPAIENAALIAAAPDLYAACELAMSSLDTYRTAGAFTAGQPSGWLLNQLRAALAKARGESS